jgi:hypothetical protein
MVYLIAGGVLLFLLLCIFATDYLANVVSQLFEIVGRLVNDFARETEAASHTLKGLLAGVLDPHTHPTRERARAPTSSESESASSTEAPAGKQSASAQDEDRPEIWIAEIIFTRLLYLVTVVVVVGSDFVLAILRLQAVLFPTLPTPVRDLSALSLLIGGLFVSIVLLTGALTLDFMDVLPKAVRLFPDITTGQRIFLLFVSVISFVLSLVAVGLLFFQGQVLTSLANANPVGAVFLATLIGVLQVLVVFLGAWGAIRGLAILLALLGGLIGVALHLVAIALRWVGDAIDLLGTVVLRNLILAIAALFGRREAQQVRAPSATSALSIVGFGDRSSSFTALLCEDVATMYGRSGLLAGGTYSSEPAVQDAAHARLVRAGVNDISPLSAHDTEPLVTLKTHLLATYQRKKAVNKVLLWVVDGERAAQAAGMLQDLKREAPDLTITILCLLPPEGIRKSDPFGVLGKLFVLKQGANDTTITTTIIVDDRSPLYIHHGEPLADRLVARTLSGMLLAPQHSTGNPSFLTVMRGLTDDGKPFAALAIDSDGVATTSQDTARAGSQSRGSGSVAPETALDATTDLANKLLTGATATTIAETLNKPYAAGPYISFIVPITAKRPEFASYRGLISRWLADEKDLYLYGVVQGQGVETPESATKSNRHVQVGVLYAVKNIAGLNRASDSASSSTSAQ